MISIDGPGHGASTAVRRRFTMEECAEAATAVLDALGVTEPVDWVGNAWGGHVGLVAAAHDPDRCRSVVTVGTPTQALSRTERAKIVPMVWAYRVAGPIPPLTTAVMNVLLGKELRERTRNSSKPCHASSGRHLVVACTRRCSRSCCTARGWTLSYPGSGHRR
ncbi:alpha/beta fold hydrolase [Rhodococcus sp. NPDC019627]|uniref:alpha/beta fold hydrolase n=1 Tax=unclassified Rhodococcus (in: high G+C Gram-positive bacteria) TaxID=192944 RepID=UPI0033CE133B